MAADDDPKGHALNSSQDFYALLEVQPTANESEIRRAYRRTALKYHPDKVGANPAALEKFHLLRIAYDVLLDSTVRQLYDNARRAREEKKEREAAYEGRRRHLKEELERRESAGVGGLKRKREDAQEEEEFQRELRRLAADGARRRKEREEQLRKEAQDEYAREEEVTSGKAPNDLGPNDSNTPAKNTGSDAEEIDRTVVLRYPVTAGVSHVNPQPIDRELLLSRFSRFGKVEEIVLRNKKIKVNGEKHRRDYTTAIVVFESVAGARAAVLDIPSLTGAETEKGSYESFWTILENVGLAAGKEPDIIPKSATPTSTVAPSSNDGPPDIQTSRGGVSGNTTNVTTNDGVKTATPFSSINGLSTPTLSRAVTNGDGMDLGSFGIDELTMTRLKNAERERLAENMRKEEQQAEAADAAK